MRRNKLLLLAKGIIALLLISSIQAMAVQANSISLFLSDSSRPCSMSSMHASGSEHHEKSASESVQMDHSCCQCHSAMGHCQNNCGIGSSTMVIPVSSGAELEVKPVSTFYAYTTFPSTLLQPPKLRPPRA